MRGEILHLLFGSDGGTLASDSLETGLDGLHRTTGVTLHTLKEEQPGKKTEI